MLRVIWVYRVRQTAVERFRVAYGADGLWASLFGRDPGYHGSELHRDHTQQNRFMAIDRWENLEAYEAFKRTHPNDYRAADGECANLFEDQRCIGFFETNET